MVLWYVKLLYELFTRQDTYWIFTILPFWPIQNLNDAEKKLCQSCFEKLLKVEKIKENWNLVNSMKSEGADEETPSGSSPPPKDQVQFEEEQEQQQWVGHRTCTEEEFLSLRKTMNSIMFKFVLHINIISRCPWGISLAFKGSPNQHTYVTNCIPIRYLYFLYFLILINFMCR